MDSLTQSQRQAYLQHPLFARHPSAWQGVMEQLRLREHSKDEVIIHHGDTANGLWLVFSGWVKLTRQTPDGKETIIGLCTAGDVFGEAALFPNARYPYHAQVIGDHAQLACIPTSLLASTVNKDHSMSGDVMALLNQHMAQAQLQLEHMSTLSAAQRLGCFMLRLCQQQSEGSITLQIPVEKHILAAYLGMKPETLSRSQQQLKPIGISVSGHQVGVNDIETLREFVCNSCSESGSCSIDTDTSH